eukprot:3742602-Prymnesium_polylepis.1
MRRLVCAWRPLEWLGLLRARRCVILHAAVPPPATRTRLCASYAKQSPAVPGLALPRACSLQTPCGRNRHRARTCTAAGTGRLYGQVVGRSGAGAATPLQHRAREMLTLLAC